MQITVTFDNLDEMREFTEKIMVGGALAQQCSAMEQPKAEASAEQPAAVPAVPTAAPKAPVTAPVTAPTAPVNVQPTAPAPVAPTTPAVPVPTTAVTYTPDDLARAAMALMDSGKQQELIGLLGQFGVVAIQELRPEQYGAFATALRGMGAQI